MNLGSRQKMGQKYGGISFASISASQSMESLLSLCACIGTMNPVGRSVPARRPDPCPKRAETNAPYLVVHGMPRRCLASLAQADLTIQFDFSSAARASACSAPVSSCTILAARSRSFAFAGFKSTIRLLITLPSRITRKRREQIQNQLGRRARLEWRFRSELPGRWRSDDQSGGCPRRSLQKD